MTLRQFVISLVTSAMLIALASLGAGEALSRPATRVVGEPPADLGARTITQPVAGGGSIVGWYLSAPTTQGAILLLHGVRSDRRSMVERARLFKRLGYSVLLIDLPAHGESSGERITFGLREGEGVKAALAFLRSERPTEPIGVIGVSLGAASMVLSGASPAPDAVVLESMYPTIQEAVTDRLTHRLGPMGNAIAPLLLVQVPLRLGLSTDQLRPIAKLPDLHAPVLIASGTRDQHTTIAETERLFVAAREPKAFWAVDGAAHVDLYNHSPRNYEQQVGSFLARYLRQSAG